ncbi:two-component system sensor histidine kinase NtrB [Hydrocarboniphaga sp.]|uniref:two-component system sensor histidine kinase NtrB n=1 Tax=Hydrocarboniphaga sp. TaxID=2033016 RepID=UPI003D107DF5
MALPDELESGGVPLLAALRDSASLAGRLQESLELYRAILDTAIDGIITIDERGRIESFNQAAERIFGYAAPDVLGSNISRLMPKPYRSQHDANLGRYLATGERRIIGRGREVQGQRRDGSVFPMELAVGEVQLEGRKLFTGITRDISDRKMVEEQARHRLNELAHVSRLAAMGEMATALAHEVNQPLTAIISHATACMRMLGHLPVGSESLQEVLIDSLTQISRQGERAAEVIKRLRSFVRKGEMEFRAESINAVVHDVLWLAGHECRAASVTVELNLQEPLPRVAMDRIQIEQVVFNLLRNSIEAVSGLPEERRCVRIRTRLSEQDGHAQVVCSLEDQGSGFSGEAAERLFEPYYTTKTNGLGQGLSICQSILEAHSGHILAERLDPVGARFSFWLPLARQ